MCNLFIVYYKFFILHCAKAYLGPFQTSMMDFFQVKFAVVAIAVTSTWRLESIILWSKYVEWLMEEFLQIKVKALSSLYYPTFCLTSVPRASFFEGIIQNGNLCNFFLKNRLWADRGWCYYNLPLVLFLITL